MRALVAAYVPRGPDGCALALRADALWTSPERFDAEGYSVRVAPCPGPLAVREALANHTDPNELLVLLTPCSGSDLGLDVQARLVKRDVLPRDRYVSVLALFGATVLDPELVDDRWLLDDLVELAPAPGWRDRPTLGDVLDADTAWRAWERVRLGIDDPPVDAEGLIRLGERPQVATALAELAPERRHRVAERWAQTGAGRLATIVVDLLVGGHGAHLPALGLVADVLWAPTDDADDARTQLLARARLEGVFGRDRLTPTMATAWAHAAHATVTSSPTGGFGAGSVDEAERLLRETDAAQLAAHSDVLPSGFELRLRAVAAALADGDVEQAASRVAWASGHSLAARRRHRLDAAMAAVRLLRRQRTGAPPSPSTFAEEATLYATDGSYVDEALRLLEDGDSLPELATAYGALTEQVRTTTGRTSARFAEHLVHWSEAEPLPDPRIVPLENLLDEVVAPVAAAAPVLLLVCDGLGLPVAHALLRDLWEEQWAPAAPADRVGWPVGVALLPTVTEASRTSLLAGRRMVGGQQQERVAFAEHPALCRAAGPSRQPVLFHKSDLLGPTGVALDERVRMAVADPDQRVVGVVVNAIDDHLARGDQLRIEWDLASLRPLGWLLDAAAEAGRVVVLTADHGHVLHPKEAATLMAREDGGERWRAALPPPCEGELEIRGPRVLLGGGHVVLPIDRRIRYGGHKHGYHGGATPEEVLVPVVALARQLPEGWRFDTLGEPAWWTGAAPPSEALGPGQAAAAVFPAAVHPLAPEPANGREDGPLTLFDTVASSRATTVVPAQSWVDELLSSPVFHARRQGVRLARPLAEDRLRRCLAAIDANGGAIPLAALAARTGEPVDTLRMTISQVQRLVNVDGTAVLSVGADDTVVLDRQLAALQFEIGEE